MSDTDTRACPFCGGTHVFIDICTPGHRVDSRPDLLFTCASKQGEGTAVCTGGIHAVIGGILCEAVCACACHVAAEAPAELPPELMAVLRDKSIPVLSAESANDLINALSDSNQRHRAELVEAERAGEVEMRKRLALVERAERAEVALAGMTGERDSEREIAQQWDARAELAEAAHGEAVAEQESDHA